MSNSVTKSLFLCLSLMLAMCTMAQAAESKEITFARNWHAARQSILREFQQTVSTLQSLHPQAQEAGLLASETPRSLSQISEWRAAVTKALQACPENIREQLRKTISQLDTSVRKQLQPMALQSKRMGWKQREGSLWALLSPFGSLASAGKEFQTRYDHVEDFGWQPKSKAKQYQTGMLRHGQTQWMSAADANAKHSDWDQAWTLQTIHFRMRGTIDYRLLSRLSLALEAEFDFFVGAFSDSFEITIPSTRMEVYVFRDQEEYRKQFTHFTGKPAGEEGGRFDSGTDRSYFFYYENTGRVRRDIDFEQVCLHEVSHQLMDQLVKEHRIGFAVAKPHFWIMEGLADFMGMLHLDGIHAYPPDRKTILASGRYRRAQQLITDDALVSMQAFLSFNQASYYTGEEGGVDHYAQGAMLAAYLFQRDPVALGRYTDDVLLKAKGNKIKFADYFHSTLTETDTAFRHWLHSLDADEK